MTAGPTHEDCDPVRFLTNRSSGKMGYALARVAWRRGAEVCLVSGPSHLPAPYGVERVWVRSAQEMLAAVQETVFAADVSAHGRGGGRLSAGKLRDSKRSSGAGTRPRFNWCKTPISCGRSASSRKPAGGGGIRGGDPRSRGRGPAKARGEEPGFHRGQRRHPEGLPALRWTPTR